MLTLLATEAGEEAAEAANPILPTSNELFWGALCFFALWALVKFVLLPPVKQIMDQRADTVRADLDAADQARATAGSAASEVQDQLADVRTEASAVVDAARAEADAEVQQILAADTVSLLFHESYLAHTRLIVYDFVHAQTQPYSFLVGLKTRKLCSQAVQFYAISRLL